MTKFEDANSPTRCAIYVRSATDATTGHNTIERQVANMRAHTAKIGWEVTAEYCDGAASGLTLKHEGISRLLHDASNGDFDVVLIQSVDRISRDITLAEDFLRKMRAISVKVYSVDDSAYLDEPPPAKITARLLALITIMETLDDNRRNS